MRIGYPIKMNTTLPNWLDSTPITSPTTEPQEQKPSSGTDLMTYREMQFTNLFPTALDRLSLGHQLIDICDDDPRGISPAEFMRWIKRDKTRYEQYKESQEIAAEFLVYSALKAAGGNDSMNDVNRDKLIAETSLKIAGAWSPKRYGKEVGLPLTGGNQPITINIGQVESPYAVVDVVTDRDSGGTQLVTDVEVKGE
jgi:hypothetical protein